MPTIRDLAKARVVVVGDAMIDVWVHGRVERISPEAPVPVFVEERREERPGGALNVVVNLRALGCDVGLATALKRSLKTRFVVHHQQIFRADDEDCSAIDEKEQDRIFSIATALPCDVLIISDYAKGVCTPSLCQRLIKWAKANGVTVVVDPKGDDWTKYAGADLLTPNEKELDAVILGRWHVAENYLVTRNAQGMRLLCDNDAIDIPATNTGPVDVTGAGDTVVAVLSAAISVGYDLESAARLANAAAGVVVGKFGTATCSLDELEAAVGEPTKKPIVGFANGVFDCFHDGHRHFLRECQLNCDKLIVALNVEEYARAKGALDSEAVRHMAVSRYADDVLFFDSEEDLLKLIYHVHPDVIFKGDDYFGKPVTGGDLARIHWVARHPGYSSTIERQKKMQAEPPAGYSEPIAAEDM